MWPNRPLPQGIPLRYTQPPPGRVSGPALIPDATPVNWPRPGVREYLLDLAAQHGRIAREIVPRVAAEQRQLVADEAPPWTQMPADGQPFDVVSTIALPNPPPSAETVVVSYTVPPGWDGVITGIGNIHTGSGFDEGSGDIIWRIRRDGAYVRNYDNILVSFGDVQNPRDVAGGIRIYSNELVEYTVEHFANALLTQSTICQTRGWFWPRRTN